MHDPNRPKISIITCFLNVEPYIHETIQSVLHQEYLNWELVLIDDGSTDRSTQIAKEYSGRFPEKIIYCEHENHENRGSGKSRNLGIQLSTGSLIAFLDADDILLPDMLQALLKIKQDSAAALVLEASEYWYDWVDTSRGNEIIEVGTTQNKLFAPPELMRDLYPLGNGAAPCICGMLAEKSAVLKHGAFDEYFTGMYDDQSFLIKFYLHEKVYVSDGCHNRYRQRPGSLVHSSHGLSNYLSERKKFLFWLKDYLRNEHISNREI
ncbi:MAG: glycosyltransferase family 2 protein, partial [Ginsengibacter sp.]